MSFLIAYVGPDTMLPIASVAAALIGGLLFAWRWVAGLFRSLWHACTGRGGSSGGDDEAPESSVSVTPTLRRTESGAGGQRTAARSTNEGR